MATLVDISTSTSNNNINNNSNSPSNVNSGNTGNPRVLARLLDEITRLDLPFHCELDLDDDTFDRDVRILNGNMQINNIIILFTINFKNDYPLSDPIVYIDSCVPNANVINRKFCYDFSPVITLKQLLCMIYLSYLDSMK